MNYIIKKATLENFNEVVNLVHKAIDSDFSEYSTEIKHAYKSIFSKKEYKNILRKKTNAILCAFSGKKIVGCLTLKGDFGGAALIDWLVIKKEFRRQGIGSALLKKTESWALKHFYHYLYLYTESDKNIKFYKQKGFEYAGLCRNSWFGINEHLMQKILRDKPFDEIYKKFSIA